MILQLVLKLLLILQLMELISIQILDFGYIWRISEEEINTIKLLIEQLVLLLYMTDLDDVLEKRV